MQFNNKPNLISGTFWGVLAKLLATGAAFILLPILLENLGSQKYGIWVTIGAASSLLGFMDLWLGNSLMGYLSKNQDDPATIKRYIHVAYSIQLRIVLLLLLLLLLLFSICFSFIPWRTIFDLAKLDNETSQAIYCSFLFFIIGLLSNTIYSIQRGMQQSRLASVWQLIATISSFSGSILVLRFQPTIAWVVFTSTGIPVIIGLVNAFWYLKKGGIFNNWQRTTPAGEPRIFLGTSGLLLYLQIAATIAFQTDALIIAHSSNYNEVLKFAVIARFFPLEQFNWMCICRYNGLRIPML